MDPDADFIATNPEWALVTYFGCEDQLEAFAEVLGEALPSGKGINDVTRSKLLRIEVRTHLSGSHRQRSRWLWLGPFPCYADADRPELMLLPRERRPAALRDCEPPSRPERDFAYTFSAPWTRCCTVAKSTRKNGRASLVSCAPEMSQDGQRNGNGEPMRRPQLLG